MSEELTLIVGVFVLYLIGNGRLINAIKVVKGVRK